MFKPEHMPEAVTSKAVIKIIERALSSIRARIISPLSLVILIRQLAEKDLGRVPGYCQDLSLKFEMTGREAVSNRRAAGLRGSLYNS